MKNANMEHANPSPAPPYAKAISSIHGLSKGGEKLAEGFSLPPIASGALFIHPLGLLIRHLKTLEL